MTNTTVAEFANELKRPADALLEQLQAAGVGKTAASDVLTDTDKQRLLTFLEASQGHGFDLLAGDVLQVEISQGGQDVPIQNLGVVDQGRVLACMFDPLQEHCGIAFERHAGLLALKRWLAQGKACLDLLCGLFGRLLGRLPDANPLGLPHALVVDEDPPGTLPLPNLHAHRLALTRRLPRVHNWSRIWLP